MTMQGDGNLVLYRGSHPLWASGTDGCGPGCHAVLHDDNLFAVYNSRHQCIWSSNITGVGTGAHTVSMQDDGNFLQRDGNNNIVWDTETHGGRDGDRSGRIVHRIGRTAIRDIFERESDSLRQRRGGERDSLRQNETLSEGRSLVSSNGKYRMTMQNDGNLVLYRGCQPLWASGTCGHGPGCYAVLRDNNLFVVYTRSREQIWSSDVRKRGEMHHCKMQDDGNFVQYNSNNRPIWCTRTDQGQQGDTRGGIDVLVRKRTQGADKDTLRVHEKLNEGQSLVSSNGSYRMTMQGDGNLVLYRGSHPLWASGTDGCGPGCHAVLHHDNLFAVYNSRHQCIWDSQLCNSADGSHYVVMQNDGNFVQYDSSNRPIWCTRTDGGKNGDRSGRIDACGHRRSRR